MAKKKNILFIINPVSGIGKKNVIPSLLELNLDPDEFNYSIEFTEYRNHGAEIANANKDKYDAIVAVGGDGSVNEIGGALVNGDCALGIIPAGSGNGLARHLNIPLKVEKAIKRIADFNLVKIDTGKVNDRIFLGTCGFGFDAHIARKFDEYHKRGFISYARLVLSEYKAYNKPTFTITIEGESFKRQAIMCSIANSSQFGNGFVISPESKINDGKFELIFLEDFKASNALNLGTRFFTGSIHKSKKFECFEFTNSISIQVDKSEEVDFHVDGEPLKNGTNFVIKINKSSLNMI